MRGLFILKRILIFTTTAKYQTMDSAELLEKIKKVDLRTEVDLFYSLLWKRISFLTSKESEFLMERSASGISFSPLHAAHHYFADGMFNVHASDFSKALSSLTSAIEIFTSLEHKGGMMASRTAMCICYRAMGQLDKAQNVVQEALNHAGVIGKGDAYIFFKAVTYYQAAEVNVEIRNYEAAIELFNTGLDHGIESDDMKGRLLNGLGAVYMNLERWEEAIRYLERSYDTITGKNNIMLEAKILSDMGIYYFKKNLFEDSFTYQEKSLNLRIENNLLSPAVTNYIRMADLCLASGKLEDALQYATKAVEQSEKLKLYIKLYESHQVLSRIYEQLGDVEKAYLHYKKYHQAKDEVHSQEVIRKMEQIKNQHKVESAEQEKEIFRLRNVELKAAMDEITESFRYAKRIQTAILPPDNLIKKVLPQSFVLFKPKDIVSGDFYWLEIIEDKIFIAAVDCTGHGVPGAMVSVVGYNCLNRTIREFGLRQPAEILNKLTELVENTFVHKDFLEENIEGEIKDGMDISICCIDLKKNLLEWSGANNPLWIVRNGVVEIAGDKQPVGKFDYRKPFTNHQIGLYAGDNIYLFTDGYADQFGGPHGKKFKYKQLKEILLSLSDKNMTKQKEVLDDSFESWKGQMEQVDDVLMIGLKIA
jgi:serine phosphatase RsbU (regulator of sigma subunit)